jgi:DNA topoisomerase-1
MVQVGDAEDEQKPRFAGLKKGQSIETITLEEAMDLFKLPRTLGQFEESEVVVASGRFGPYVKHKSQFYTLPKGDDPLQVGLPRAIEVIQTKRQSDSQKVLHEFRDGEQIISILNGRYGAYIFYNKENYRIPKGKDPKSMTLSDVKAIISNSEPTRSKAKKKK